MNDLFTWSLGKSREQILNLVADLSEEQMCLQSVDGENHPAWTLGHLYLGDCLMLSLLQIPNAPQMPDGWWEIYAPGQAPTADSKRYHSKKQLVEQLIESDKVRRQVIGKLTATDLAQPTLEPQIASVQPTLGHVLHYLLFHEGNHAGQLAAWRKTQGLPSGSGAFGIV